MKILREMGNPRYHQTVRDLDWLAFAQNFRFDRMRPRDIEEVIAIERRVYPDPWSRWIFYHEMFENPMAHLRVLRTRQPPERLVGYATLRLMGENAHLTNLALHPDFIGRGLGRYFLAYVMDYAHRRGGRRMWLEVRKGNRRALRLYARFGFRFMRELPGYYPNGDDALVLAARLERLAPDGGGGTVTAPRRG